MRHRTRPFSDAPLWAKLLLPFTALLLYLVARDALAPAPVPCPDVAITSAAADAPPGPQVVAGARSDSATAEAKLSSTAPPDTGEEASAPSAAEGEASIPAERQPGSRPTPAARPRATAKAAPAAQTPAKRRAVHRAPAPRADPEVSEESDTSDDVTVRWGRAE